MPKVWQCVGPEVSAILWQLVWCPPEKFSLVTRTVRFILCLRVRAPTRKCGHYSCGVAVSPSRFLYPFWKRKFICIFIHKLFSSSTSINFFPYHWSTVLRLYILGLLIVRYIWLLKGNLQVELRTIINHSSEIRSQYRNYGTLELIFIEFLSCRISKIELKMK